MKEDLSKYDLEDRVSINRTAKRNIRSECTAILSAGFAMLMIIFFWFSNYTFLPLAVLTGVGPVAIWVILSFATAAHWAWIHYIRSGPIISKSQHLSAQFLYQYQAEQRAERELKYQEMRKRTGDNTP